MNNASRNKAKRGGFAVIEFTLVGIPVIFLTISIIEASIAMWQYHSMMYANEIAARYASMHGHGCTQNGNTCTITVGTVAHIIANQAPSLNTANLDVTLYTNSGSTACNPITSCYNSSTQFPSNTDNQVGYDVRFVATYPIYNPLPLLWPGAGHTAGSVFTLGSTTRQRIVF